MDQQYIDDLAERSVPIIFAVDQDPFDLPAGAFGRNWFCVLQPLITESGKRFTNRAQLFPQRGRVWWMLREDMDPQVIKPGMVITGTLEKSRDHGKDIDKDWFQVSRRSVQFGTSSHVEIIETEKDWDVPALLRHGIPCSKGVLERVILRGPNAILGPFRGQYDAAKGRVRLEAPNSGSPFVCRWRREQLEGVSLEFEFLSNEHNPKGQKDALKISLVSQGELTALAASAEKLDAATEQQVLNWGFKHLKVVKKDQQHLKELLQKTEGIGAQVAENPMRWERFVDICRRGSEAADLGVEAAEAVAGQPCFKELLDRYKGELLRVRVEEELEKQRASINLALASGEEKRQRLKEDIRRLEEEFEQKSRENAETFKRENQEKLEQIDAREAAVEAREAALAQAERDVETRLESVIGLYREESRRVLDQFLAEVPLLQRAGVFQARAPGETASGHKPELSLPAFLRSPRSREPMEETVFLDQLQHVAARRGFAFEQEDLVDFHTAVKVGFWTVLAGASGLGKSTLSRLYAEALGAGDEYLSIPVRPDWLDDRDVIGAFNAISERYEPAASGLVDRLIAAKEDQRANRGGIYLVCLDEMNLARVEHYFAAFLSIMELPQTSRALPLFAAGLERLEDPYSPHRILQIGENVRFVGTVNIDETTHFFSPKVLDRASVVTLARPDLKRDPGRVVREGALGGIVPVHLDVYQSWIGDPESVSPKTLETLYQVDAILRRARSGVSFRVRDRITSYVASARNLVGEDKALDMAIRGSIAPRIRPSGSSWVKAIDDLRKLLPQVRFPRSTAVFEALTEAEGELGFFQLF